VASALPRQFQVYPLISSGKGSHPTASHAEKPTRTQVGLFNICRVYQGPTVFGCEPCVNLKNILEAGPQPNHQIVGEIFGFKAIEIRVFGGEEAILQVYFHLWVESKR